LYVGGEIPRINICDAGNESRTQEGEKAGKPALPTPARENSFSAFQGTIILCMGAGYVLFGHR
jgi:hypothetical protein